MTLAAPWFADALLAWFDVHGRHHLPWQQDPTPYRVWVSEIMLQQTQVATVVTYYPRFMARFPTVQSLAAASVDEVLHLWTGLGYYARARNLKQCADRIVADHGGEFPATRAAVEALPGIGRSTAAAILALSRAERHAILDGNVKRVLARVFGIGGDPGAAVVLARFWAQAEALTPARRPGAYTQAIMDLGATVCTRSRPACTLCPLAVHCVAAREGRQAELPHKKKPRQRGRRAAFLLLVEAVASSGSRFVYLERRPERGIWGGLWAPPQFAQREGLEAWCRREIGGLEREHLGLLDALEVLAPIEHAFTHFDLHLQPFRILCDGDAVSTLAGGGKPGCGEPAAAVAEPSPAARGRWYPLTAGPPGGLPLSGLPQVGLPQPIVRLLERMSAKIK